MALGGRALELMPKMHDIPESLDRKWTRFMSDWFYRGLNNLSVTPKDGIDPVKAMRHLKAIMGSWEPKHEHKEAAVAYLASLWFEDVAYEVAK